MTNIIFFMSNVYHNTCSCTTAYGLIHPFFLLKQKTHLTTCAVVTQTEAAEWHKNSRFVI